MNTIEQYIDAEMNGKITRKKNSPLPSLLVLAVGIGLLVLIRTKPLSDSLMATCLTIGILATVAGLILTAMSITGAMTHFVYLPTRSRMRDKKVYVSGDDFKDIDEALGNGDLRTLATIRPVVSSNSALRILVSADKECALVQAIRDQSGHFEPETATKVLTSREVAAVEHLLK